MKGSTSAQIVGAGDEIVKLLEWNHSQFPRGIALSPNGERLYALWNSDDERFAVRRAFEKNRVARRNSRRGRRLDMDAFGRL